MSIDVCTEAIHNIDRVVALELPGSRLERVRQVIKCADWAKVNDIAGKLVVDHSLNVGRNFILLAAHDLTKSKLTSDQLGEADASSAVNAAGHRCLDQRSEVLVLDTALVLHEAAFCVAVDSRDVLEITLATLVTNRAVKRMISKKKLHHTTIIINSLD